MGRDLAEARSAWDVSPKCLADQCELEEADVVAAERGDADVTTFAELADALGGCFDDLRLGRRFWEAPVLAFRSAPAAVEAPLVRATLLRLSRAASAHRAASEILAPSEKPLEVSPAAVASDTLAQAEELAVQVRAALENPGQAIASVREALRRFGFGTFLSSFGAEKVDGLSWRDAEAHGYAAANVDARGGSVTAVRMTFAHELCHLLFDGLRGQPFGIFEQRSEYGDALEQRANAFAAHFLAPRAAVLRFLARLGVRPGKKPNPQHVLALSSHFGIGVQAMGAHLHSLHLWERADMMRHPGLRTTAREGPDTAERDDRQATFISLERRGEVLDMATAALADGVISLGRWRELVGVGLFEDVTPLLAEREALDHVEFHSM